MKLEINGVETVEITDPKGACDKASRQPPAPNVLPQGIPPATQPAPNYPQPTIIPQLPTPFIPDPFPGTADPWPKYGDPLPGGADGRPWSKWMSGDHFTTGNVDTDSWTRNMQLGHAADEIEGKDDDGNPVFK